MRRMGWMAAGLAALALTGTLRAQEPPPMVALSDVLPRDLAGILDHQPAKPDDVIFEPGQDNCRWALDGECDELRFGGTGVCADYTDDSDCQQWVAGLDNSCAYAFDRRCDEARYGGSGYCQEGSDTTDCRGMAAGGDDSCLWANDGECDEPGIGTGVCTSFTDVSDCAGLLPQLAGTGPAADGGKPGGSDTPQPPQPAPPVDLGNDSCRWAHDMECDDIRFDGTGACPVGTDASDCRALALGGDNSCRWANDGECDEPSIGLGVCTSGTDTNDCQAMAHLRNRTNECATAFNGICEEADLGGNGACEFRTDTVDCYGRQTVAGVQDHYFGEDNRTLVDSGAFPWRAIGQIELDGGGFCTATMVSPSVAVTAAHCFSRGEGRYASSGMFYAGLDRDLYVERAGIADVYVNPEYNDHGDPPLGQGNGDDWAFFTTDWAIGDEVGWLDVYAPSEADFQAAESGGWFTMNQGGYSWDTGDRLSAHLGCRIVRHFPDGTIFHECDTTLGDSGSPIFIERGQGDYAIIAVDSQFFPDRSSGYATSYLAVDARSFADELAAYIARRGGDSAVGTRKTPE